MGVVVVVAISQAACYLSTRGSHHFVARSVLDHVSCRPTAVGVLHWSEVVVGALLCTAVFRASLPRAICKLLELIGTDERLSRGSRGLVLGKAAAHVCAY